MRMKIVFGFAFCLLSGITIAQNTWVDMMQDPSVNFYDVQDAFENYFQNHPIEKGKGWKQFKRWEAFMEPRVFPNGNRDFSSKTFQAYQDYIIQHPVQRSSVGQWTYFGNQLVPSGGGGAGRINTIAFDPINNNIIYVGTPAGGIWKTTDGGTHWNPLDDQLASLGIGSIATHPTDPNILYVGTGDGDGSDMYSVGVLKSTDAGASFQTTGLSFSYNSQTTIRKLIINPNDPDVLLVATNNGIFKTSDAGATWSTVQSGGYYDLEFKPGNPNVVYAATQGRLFRSTNGGNSFTQVTNGLPTGINAAGRIAIGVTPADTNYVYLLIGKNSDYGFFGLYRSIDGGDNFTMRSDSPNLMGWDANGGDEGGQAWYDLAIVVSATNKNTIWTGGVNVWKSTNGGTSWVLDAHWYGDGGEPYVHADIHAMENIPGAANSFLIGCDGGIFKTSNNGTNYSDISNNLKISQIYKFSNSTSNPDLIISGWQDNGTNLRSTNAFNRILGGDGMDCIIDHSNNNTMYGEYYYGRIYKSTNGGNNFNKIVDSDDTLVSVDEKGEWVTPYIMHPTSSNTLLVGKSQLFRSTNGGSTWSQVGSISGGSGKLIALAYGVNNTNYIYAIKKNRVYASTDGNTMNDVTGNLPTTVSMTNIAVDPNDANRVWVTFSGFNSTTKVYYSSTGGTTWSNISTGLPNIPVNCIVYQNGSSDGIYIGTDMGVFYLDASMTSWQYYSNGLPNTIVNDLEIYYPLGKLRAATYGRGIWETELFSNIANDAELTSVSKPNGNVCQNNFSPEIKITNTGDNDLYTFKIKYFIDANTPDSMLWNGLLHPDEYVTLNLPPLNSTLGAHTFTVFVTEPNNGIDGNITNDLMTTSFTIISNGNEVELNLTPDCFGEEISWTIEDGSSNIIFQVNNGYYSGTTMVPDFNPTVMTTSVCLPAGCYVFTIDDDSGNGLSNNGALCDGNGTYFMNDNAGTLLFTDASTNGNFGNSATHNFCVASVYAADFSVSPNQICAGSSVSFYDLSTPGTNSWSWTLPGATPNFSNSQNPTVFYNSPGTYDVILSAGDGTNTNAKTVVAQITVFDQPIASSVFDSVLCFGDCNAMIDLTVSGGTSPISIMWNDGYTTEDRNNLCSGNYDAYLMDDNGCRDTILNSIYSPMLINSGMNITQATCGVADGTANTSVSGGTPPFSYLWSNGMTSSSISALNIGAYTVIITDDNNCVFMDTISITNPNAPMIISSSIDESCLGECDGELNSLASGGTGNLNYLWSNGAGTTDSVNMVCPGTYYITVTDDNGCAAIDSVVVVNGTNYPIANFVVSTDTVQLGNPINFVNLSSGANQHTWDFGDGDFSNFSSTSHTYDSLGLYTVILTSCKNGCCDSDTMQVFVGDFTDINEWMLSSYISVFPNPTQNFIQVNVNHDFVNTTYIIYDAKGAMVLNGESTEKNYSINMSHLSKGMYFMHIYHQDVVLPVKLIKN